MPADYSSTAKALALPISPSPSPSPNSERNAARPPWSRRLSSTSRRPASNSPYSQHSRPTSALNQVLSTATTIYQRVWKTFRSLSPIQQVLAATALICINVFGILFLVYSEKIFHVLGPWAKKWHGVTGGWVVLWIITFFCAFPPVIGYSTAVTISGFVYGFPGGWYIVSTASVAGSLASFLASRTIFSSYVERLVGNDKRFEALALTLKHDGIKILCMIRLCPLPYSLSNAAMSTFPTVHPLAFAAATAITSPKLLIHVFIGSRMAVIAEKGGQMSTGTKAINYTSMILGGLLGATMGWIIYSRTLKRAKELEIAELESGQREVGSPALGRRYSDEEIDSAALMNDDDISLWDHEDGGFERRIEDPSTYRDEFTDDEDVFASGDVDEPRNKTNVKP
ncbi:hypothetical protein GLAREA_05378 [Glarea lozoyensis ATCC 20868]|uniref:Golgi apparatus membrane protein TVP38 n=1 Tax=Glarea lozoyensis (strain ATCC 20868 / MF5171) TaxID=1116229 RepID=S3DE56_GLAL2|nr:uncharacterized protein GLAREA_05378 [Glarea lozoyensis ATCC 20868]EPE36040.1 hypothetical protein GLAREA_05378 [Glarea lozoyensis ATCC 20868]